MSAYSPLLDWLPATSLCLWCLSYSLGLGPIPWAYSNELLPTDVRAQLYSLTACLVSTIHIEMKQKNGSAGPTILRFLAAQLFDKSILLCEEL